ncbi:28S ribosomal protein S27, mitochondrial [Colossoma macropomum]|uniref:28S ribosomal protein S27, mitochondrial n=1 Tax=Colossoma macropomum TaxID=42526 RepID=UPI0018655CB7|nr:28S ribosomal protein S27, mitochondrial [Colossoma macropomum]
MAASTLQRFLLPVRNAAKCAAFNLTARRCLLSEAYTDIKVWEQRESDPQSLAELASLMDRSYERKFPVSSLTISRFVDSISSREEVDQAEYYLYKFRHSPNCWYLRDWTVHSWFRQCLKYGARDKALYTLKNKVQFGMFPDEFTFNLLIDSYLKDEDYKGACSVVEEVMLQEAFDQPTTQILSLHALSKYLAIRPDLSWQEEKNVGAALMLAGLKQENSAGLSAQLLGHALIGKVEIARGIHAVFHQMPLIWTPGYLGRSLAVMERVCSDAGDLKLSKEVLDYLQKVLQELSSIPGSKTEEENNTENEARDSIDEEDELERAKLPQYTAKFKELSGQLQVQGKVDSGSLEALVSHLVQEKLRPSEESEVAQYQKRVQDWEAERRQLAEREKEMREKVQQERLARQAARAAR